MKYQDIYKINVFKAVLILGFYSINGISLKNHDKSRFKEEIMPTSHVLEKEHAHSLTFLTENIFIHIHIPWGR